MHELPWMKSNRQTPALDPSWQSTAPKPPISSDPLKTRDFYPWVLEGKQGSEKQKVSPRPLQKCDRKGHPGMCHWCGKWGSFSMEGNWSRVSGVG